MLYSNTKDNITHLRSAIDEKDKTLANEFVFSSYENVYDTKVFGGRPKIPLGLPLANVNNGLFYAVGLDFFPFVHNRDKIFKYNKFSHFRNRLLFNDITPMGMLYIEFGGMFDKGVVPILDKNISIEKYIKDNDYSYFHLLKLHHENIYFVKNSNTIGIGIAPNSIKSCIINIHEIGTNKKIKTLIKQDIDSNDYQIVSYFNPYDFVDSNITEKLHKIEGDIFINNTYKFLIVEYTDGSYKLVSPYGIFNIDKKISNVLYLKDLYIHLEIKESDSEVFKHKTRNSAITNYGGFYVHEEANEVYIDNKVIEINNKGKYKQFDNFITELKIKPSEDGSIKIGDKYELRDISTSSVLVREVGEDDFKVIKIENNKLKIKDNVIAKVFTKRLYRDIIKHPSLIYNEYIVNNTRCITNIIDPYGFFFSFENNKIYNFGFGTAKSLVKQMCSDNSPAVFYNIGTRYLYNTYELSEIIKTNHKLIEFYSDKEKDYVVIDKGVKNFLFLNSTDNTSNIYIAGISYQTDATNNSVKDLGYKSICTITTLNKNKYTQYQIRIRDKSRYDVINETWQPYKKDTKKCVGLDEFLKLNKTSDVDNFYIFNDLYIDSKNVFTTNNNVARTPVKINKIIPFNEKTTFDSYIARTEQIDSYTTLNMFSEYKPSYLKEYIFSEFGFSSVFNKRYVKLDDVGVIVFGNNMNTDSDKMYKIDVEKNKRILRYSIGNIDIVAEVLNPEINNNYINVKIDIDKKNVNSFSCKISDFSVNTSLIEGVSIDSQNLIDSYRKKVYHKFIGDDNIVLVKFDNILNFMYKIGVRQFIISCVDEEEGIIDDNLVKVKKIETSEHGTQFVSTYKNKKVNSTPNPIFKLNSMFFKQPINVSKETIVELSGVYQAPLELWTSNDSTYIKNKILQMEINFSKIIFKSIVDSTQSPFVGAYFNVPTKILSKLNKVDISFSKDISLIYNINVGSGNNITVKDGIFILDEPIYDIIDGFVYKIDNEEIEYFYIFNRDIFLRRKIRLDLNKRVHKFGKQSEIVRAELIKDIREDTKQKEQDAAFVNVVYQTSTIDGISELSNIFYAKPLGFRCNGVNAELHYPINKFSLNKKTNIIDGDDVKYVSGEKQVLIKSNSNNVSLEVNNGLFRVNEKIDYNTFDLTIYKNNLN